LAKNSVNEVNRLFPLLLLVGILTIANPLGTGATPRDPGLPNPILTPGSISALVTQENIHSTICVSGYTKTIRPSSSYTNRIKTSQLKSGYNYKGDTNLSNYEEDHLVPLEIGGNPTSPNNLFPQPWLTTWNAGKKDRLENRMHQLVCNGTIALVVAQKVFMNNWIIGYQKYVGR
jgi:hypothetical protein